MRIRLGVVMDPIESIRPAKDSTLAMLLEAQARGWEIRYMRQQDLAIRGDAPRAWTRALRVRDDPADWFDLSDAREEDLRDFDVVLMRKDPPVDLHFLVATWVLDRAHAAGTLVVNAPAALRDMNEKLVATRFPDCCPETLVSASEAMLTAFIEDQGTVVLKRTDLMGGRGIFVVRHGDPNTNVILEEMTLRGQRQVVAQAWVSTVSTAGDTRILMVDGEPVPQAVTRLPPDDDFRANLATGASPRPAELTERDRRICEIVGPVLAAEGVLFAGLDVIDGHLTEINVTSPTCIREIDRFFDTNVAGVLLDAIESKLG